jgi:hypothetical protein
MSGGCGSNAWWLRQQCMMIMAAVCLAWCSLLSLNALAHSSRYLDEKGFTFAQEQHMWGDMCRVLQWRRVQGFGLVGFSTCQGAFVALWCIHTHL